MFMHILLDQLRTIVLPLAAVLSFDVKGTPKSGLFCFSSLGERESDSMS